MGARTKNYRLTTIHFISQLVTLDANVSLCLLKGLVVNPSGVSGHGVSTDLFLEHLIGVTKESWSDGQSLNSMREITQNVDYVQLAKTQFKEGLGITSSSTHVKPDRRQGTIKAAKDLGGKQLHKPEATWKDPFLEGVKAELKLDIDVDLEDRDADSLRPADSQTPLGMDWDGDE